MATIRQCPNCGRAIGDHASFCISCGSKLGSEASNEGIEVLTATYDKPLRHINSMSDPTTNMGKGGYERLAPLIPPSQITPPDVDVGGSDRGGSAVAGYEGNSVVAASIRLTRLPSVRVPKNNVGGTVVYADGQENVEGDYAASPSLQLAAEHVALGGADNQGDPGSVVPERAVHLRPVHGSAMELHAEPKLEPVRRMPVTPEPPRPELVTPEVPQPEPARQSLVASKLPSPESNNHGREDSAFPGGPDSPTFVIPETPSAALLRRNTGEVFAVAPSSTLGKGTKADVIIGGTRVISRVHARIDYVEDGFYIEDLQSCNGTYVNEERLISGKAYRISAGDIVRLANEEFEFMVD